MTRVCSIFSQILQLISRLEFESAVRKHKAERHARGFTCWGQFIAMLFCQLGHAKSLREICGGLAASEGKLRHLGLPQAPARATLGYANEHRPWQLYRTVFDQLLAKCQTVAASQAGTRKKKKFRFKNPLMSLDASVIDLCATMFDWAKFRLTKGAVKLHLLLDHDGYLPSFAVITEGKKHEVRVARQMRFLPGTILVFDRGYTDYEWFVNLIQQGVYFVTRLKENADYGVVEELAVPQRRGVLRDQVIFFYKLAQAGIDAYFRRIEFYDEEHDRVLVFLTSHRELAAATIAAVYKERWQIELFFRALKQSLRVKTFVGTSAQALKTQLWTALIAMLLVKYLQLKSSFGWSLSNLVALLRQQLFVYRDLWVWIDNPFQPPPIPETLPEQLALQLAK
ncbi:MAG TPA: IS4 family transposase [Terriglobales bacterium]|nr:IS4 family transposase [Terriglobales bacterium]